MSIEYGNTFEGDENALRSGGTGATNRGSAGLMFSRLLEEYASSGMTTSRTGPTEVVNPASTRWLAPFPAHNAPSFCPKGSVLLLTNVRVGKTIVKALGRLPLFRGSIKLDAERSIRPSRGARPSSCASRSWSTESPLTSITPCVSDSRAPLSLEIAWPATVDGEATPATATSKQQKR